MSKTYKQYTPEQKAKIALEAIGGERQINQIASRYQVVPQQVIAWRKQLIDSAPALFTDRRLGGNRDLEKQNDTLLKLLGQRDVELEWLKKKSKQCGRL